jgi:hypothetical protein
MTHRIAHSLAFSYIVVAERAAGWVYPDSPNSASAAGTANMHLLHKINS